MQLPNDEERIRKAKIDDQRRQERQKLERDLMDAITRLKSNPVAMLVLMNLVFACLIIIFLPKELGIKVMIGTFIVLLIGSMFSGRKKK